MTILKQVENAAARIPDEGRREWFVEQLATADQMIASAWDRRRNAWRLYREWCGLPPKEDKRWRVIK